MIKRPPSISVVVPTRNSMEYIDECLASILAQSRSPGEVIVVDDASTDGTVAHVRSHYPRVVVMTNPEVGGQGHSRNVGIAIAQGDYVALCDHDDVWAPDHVEKVAGLLDRFMETPLAFSRVGLIGTASGCWPACAGSIPDLPKQMFVPLMRNNVIIPTGTVFRKALWREAGPFDERRPFGVDDYRFYLEAALRHPIVGRREPTAFWRIHGGQASKNRGPQVVHAFKHRLEMLSIHRNALQCDGLLAGAQTATVRCWEEHIEEAWATRNQKYLRCMVQFGLRQPILCRSTRPYVWRAALPAFVLESLMKHNVIRSAQDTIIAADN
jgi:glycosyltransferase involved in cell wall biosynthesis